MTSHHYLVYRVTARAVSAALLLLLLLLVPEPASCGGTPGGRKGVTRVLLKSEAVRTDAQCLWDSEVYACVATNRVDLAPNVDPEGVYWKFWLMALDRQTMCREQKDIKACRKLTVSHGCTWVEESSTCASSDLGAAVVFIKNNYAPSDVFTIPYGLTCPGSKLREFTKCSLAFAIGSDDECNLIKGCKVFDLEGTRICYPTGYGEPGSVQYMDLIDKLESLAPAYAGNCAGACFLRKANYCATTGKDNAKKCQEVPFCWYDASSGACMVDYFGGKAYYGQTQKLTAECEDIPTKAMCEAKKVALPQLGRWRNWSMPAEKAPCV